MSAPAVVAPGLPEYRLRSDLARYCLPSASRDDSRKLAWANSICLMFLVVAGMGVKQPVFVIREAAPLPEPMQVTLPPPVDQEQPATQEQPDEENVEEPADDLTDVPVIAPVLVAAPQDVSFSVPVEGYVVLASDARYVPPPPPVIPKAPPPDNVPQLEFKAIRFGGKEFRKQPPPNYPEEFQRNRVGGTVEVLISVDPSGLPSKVEVGKSSGSSALDRHVCDFIRREWRGQAGETGHFRIAITFAP